MPGIDLLALINLCPIAISAVPWLIGAAGVLAVAGAAVCFRAVRPVESGGEPTRPGSNLATTPRVAHRETSTSFATPPIEWSLWPERPLPKPATGDARRNDDLSLAILGARLVENRRRAAARTRLGEELARLDRRSWHVERDVTVTGVTLPFVVFGPRGLFALTSSQGCAMSDLTVLESAADELAAVLPAYPDPVRAAIYLPDDPVAPRSWFNEHGAGGWIVGGGHLLEFLEHFEDHGFSRSDIEVLRARSAPQGPAKRLVYLPRQRLQG
jgi:hypothetical protein